MIAKAATISHGGNAVRYSVNKDKADIVKVNFLPEDISAEAMYQRMVLKQKEFAPAINRGRPLKRNLIRMEISPTKEESAGWTMDDWAKLADEYIRAFDSIDLSGKTKRDSARSTNVRRSQYVAALHTDAKSGIPHLHIDVNRVDMDGKVNDDHLIAERAMAAAYIINERRGWRQPEDIRRQRTQEIADACMEVLKSLPSFTWKGFEAGLKTRGYGIRLQRDSNGVVRGYSVLSGNSAYKSSTLGRGRNLMPSKIEDTWRQLHRSETASGRSLRDSRQTWAPGPQSGEAPKPEMRHYDIATDEWHSFHVAIPRDADNVIREECSLEDAHSLARIEEIQHTALLLFAGYLDAATSMSASSGGGGSAPADGWGRDPKEDDLKWAHRCARMANRMCRRRQGRHR